MQSSGEWPAATRLDTRRLILEPLQVAHAEEMLFVLADEALYEFTGGSAPTLENLRVRYARQVSGGSPERTHGWLNWIVREREHRIPVGTVQSTLAREEQGAVAEVAWIIGVSFQRRGYAIEAVQAMVSWLDCHGVIRVTAHIDPRHAASIAVAIRLGLIPTCTVLDGETRWTRERP